MIIEEPDAPPLSIEDLEALEASHLAREREAALAAIRETGEAFWCKGRGEPVQRFTAIRDYDRATGSRPPRAYD